MKWMFPPTGGGAEYGFNDSSQEHFRSGPLEHTIRETIQNSLDAVFSDKPVKVEIQLQNIKSSDINTTELKPHINQTIKRESGQQKALKFYKKSMEIIKKKNISVLSIIDSNTSGLVGNNWNALVRSEGTPNKGKMSAAGGSYGIGKNAPYSISLLRLVGYATRYPGRPGRISQFMARCKLSSHPNPQKHTQMLQHIGFGCKDFNSNGPIPFEGRNIPNNIFKLKERGTGVFIMAPNIKDKWIQEVKLYVARYFFAAIHDKKLEVYIETTKIDNQTIDDIFREGKAKEPSRHYYDTISSPQKSTIIKENIGNFEVLLCTGDSDFPNRVAYVNRRGMRITDEPAQKRNPFQVKLPWAKYTAVVRAVDDNTDTRIREMEPPDHNSIQHDLISDFEEHKKVKEGLDLVRDKIKKFVESNCGEKNIEDDIPINDLAEILHSPGSTTSGDDDDEFGKLEHRMGRTTKRKGKGENPGGNGPKNGRKPSRGGNGPGKNGPDDGNGTGGQETDHNSFDKERIVRSKDGLKIAFTPKDIKNSIKFAIKPAGEEKQKESNIEISNWKSIAPPNTEIKIENNMIIVAPKNSQRIILEVSVNGQQYTGYEIVEMVTAPKEKRKS